MVGKTGIWSKELAEGTHVWSPKLAAAMSDILNKEHSINDLGCGKGYYVKYFQDRGYVARGLEGTSDMEFICDNIFVGDLSKPFEITQRSEVKKNVLCLEVGEHIPVEYEQVLLDNIATICNNRLIMSWAIPGQVGIGHVNCREQSYIIEQIESRGFIHNQLLTELLRVNVDDHTPWFTDTILVFDKI